MDEEKKLDLMAWLGKFGVLSQITYEPVADDDLIRLDFGVDDVIVQANRNGFRSFANMMSMFDEDAVPDGDHIHMDSGLLLARDSLNLVVNLIWPAGSDAELCASLPKPMTKSDYGQVMLRPTIDSCINVELLFNEIGIAANRSGFRVLAGALEQFDQAGIEVGETLRLRPGLDLPRESIPISFSLIDETWIEHCAACLGHSSKEIAAIRSSEKHTRAAWEEQIICEIEAYRAGTGRIELSMPPKTLG